MLIAQAKAEHLTLVTRDAEIAKYDLEILAA
jgi:PIN domain nuclease of toxin-antitoxin system